MFQNGWEGGGKIQVAPMGGKYARKSVSGTESFFAKNITVLLLVIWCKSRDNFKERTETAFQELRQIIRSKVRTRVTQKVVSSEGEKIAVLRIDIE